MKITGIEVKSLERITDTDNPYIFIYMLIKFSGVYDSGQIIFATGSKYKEGNINLPTNYVEIHEAEEWIVQIYDQDTPKIDNEFANFISDLRGKKINLAAILGIKGVLEVARDESQSIVDDVLESFQLLGNQTKSTKGILEEIQKTIRVFEVS